MAYHLEGRLLEVCDCRVLCPCWIGEDPDNGTCNSVLAYHFDAGTIDGVDVTGRTIAMVSHIPGNVLAGNFRVAVYLDDGTSDAQQEALLNVYTGKLGGPIADFAKLVGEVVGIERTPIRFERRGWPRHADDRRGQPCRDRAVQGPGRRDDDPQQHNLFDGAGCAGVCRQGHPLPLAACRTRPRPRHDRPQRVAEHLCL